MCDYLNVIRPGTIKEKDINSSIFQTLGANSNLKTFLDACASINPDLAQYCTIQSFEEADLSSIMRLVLELEKYKISK